MPLLLSVARAEQGLTAQALSMTTRCRREHHVQGKNPKF
jgi:hypothetical protein